MRRLLVTTTVSALLLTSGGVVTAQEEAVAAGTFTPTGALAQVRSGHTAVLLPDGRVLITGGEGLDPGDLLTAEVWDPTTSSFGPADELAEPGVVAQAAADIGRTDHTATLLPDGRTLVVGGSRLDDPTVTKEAETYDPMTEALLPAGSLTEARSGHTATFLRDGRVLVVGGTGPDGPLSSAEVWRSATSPAKCFGKQPTLFALPDVEFVGTPEADLIAGSVGADVIRGGGGNDRICGNGGDDVVDGGGGNDAIDGGAGADRILGAGGNDRLFGSGGDDTLDGGKGKDVCAGGKGIDWLPNCNEKAKTRGTVVVTKNTKLKGPHNGRFIIGKNGVTLDCDGHTITGPGRRVELSGIELTGRDRVRVRNCDLRDFWVGFHLERSPRNTLSDNRATRVQSGFVLTRRSSNNKLVANVVIDSTGAAYVLGFRSDKNRLRDNLATKAKGSGFGVWSSRGNILTDNVARDGKLEGFLASPDGFGKPSIGNTFSGNQSILNVQWGFRDLSTGFRGDAGTDNHYAGNTCSGNGMGDSSPATLCE